MDGRAHRFGAEEEARPGQSRTDADHRHCRSHALTANLPARITADTGIDVLTHAIEGYCNNFRNDICDALCLKAVELVFHYLQRAVEKGAGDSEARRWQMQPDCWAGLWQLLCRIGTCHGSQLWCLFQDSARAHGWPVSALHHGVQSAWGCCARYAEIARYLGLSDGKDEAEASRALIDAIRQLEKRIGLPTSIAEMGISERFDEALAGCALRRGG